MEASRKELSPAAQAVDPGAEYTAPGTIRIGAIEVGLPPDPEKPMSVMHYINQNRATLWNVAKTFYMGKLVPSAILKMDDAQEAIAAVFTILSSGLELGLGYAASLRTIYVVEGRATLSSDLMRGLAMQAGCKFRYVVRTNEECQVEVSRDGHVVGIGKFTYKQALAAGLTNKNNWKSYPEAMLAARAGSIAARMGAPDRLAGLYTPDELDGGLDDPDGAVAAGAPAPRIPNPIQDAADERAGEEIRASHAARTEAVNTSLGIQKPEPGAALMTDDQRRMIFGLANTLGIKGSREFSVGSGTETRTIIKSDDEINKALGLPEGDDVVMKGLTKGAAIILIDILQKREAKRQNDQTTADASELLGQ